MMGVGGVAATVMNDDSEVGIALERVVALVLCCVMVVVLEATWWLLLWNIGPLVTLMVGGNDGGDLSNGGVDNEKMVVVFG